MSAAAVTTRPRTVFAVGLGDAHGGEIALEHEPQSTAQVAHVSLPAHCSSPQLWAGDPQVAM
jgi:hypothetical protein